MKKLTIVLSIVFLLSSCFTNPEDVNNAKKDMGIIEEEPTTIDSQVVEKNDEELSEKTNSISEPQNIVVKSLTEEKFIEIDELKYDDFLKGEAEITGTTLEKIDKIEVSFTNKTSEFPDDLFELKQFKPGDKTFVYRAHTKYRVLDFGVNEYIFTAYVGEKKSQIQIIVTITKEDEKTNEEDDIENVSYDKIKLENIEGDLNLPSGGAFGHPISLGEDGFTYSDISGLEINKYSFSGELSCDSDKVTDFLTKEIGTWFYWNTCRDIIPVKDGEKTKAISLFVIRLDGDNYLYEKHFLDLEKGLYGTYEIEKGTGVDKDNIGDKNKELKEINEDIINIDIVNNLFEVIVKG